jgi:hypothetical protein
MRHQKRRVGNLDVHEKSRRGGTPLGAFQHVGLLFNEPTGAASLPFI